MIFKWLSDLCNGSGLHDESIEVLEAATGTTKVTAEVLYIISHTMSCHWSRFEVQRELPSGPRSNSSEAAWFPRTRGCLRTSATSRTTTRQGEPWQMLLARQRWKGLDTVDDITHVAPILQHATNFLGFWHIWSCKIYIINSRALRTYTDSMLGLHSSDFHGP